MVDKSRDGNEASPLATPGRGRRGRGSRGRGGRPRRSQGPLPQTSGLSLEQHEVQISTVLQPGSHEPREVSHDLSHHQKQDDSDVGNVSGEEPHTSVAKRPRGRPKGTGKKDGINSESSPPSHHHTLTPSLTPSAVIQVDPGLNKQRTITTLTPSQAVPTLPPSPVVTTLTPSQRSMDETPGNHSSAVHGVTAAPVTLETKPTTLNTAVARQPDPDLARRKVSRSEKSCFVLFFQTQL